MCVCVFVRLTLHANRQKSIVKHYYNRISTSQSCITLTITISFYRPLYIHICTHTHTHTRNVKSTLVSSARIIITRRIPLRTEIKSHTSRLVAVILLLFFIIRLLCYTSLYSTRERRLVLFLTRRTRTYDRLSNRFFIYLTTARR